MAAKAAHRQARESQFDNVYINPRTGLNSRGTRCKQILFALSVNPPKGAEVSDAQFMDAITRAESKLDLAGLARGRLPRKTRR